MMITKAAEEEETKKKSISSWMICIVSLACVIFFTFSVIDWHHNDGLGRGRRLQSEKLNGVIDDDSTRDETCKEYLMNFLNGTTDAKDECDGMLNAYKGADCADDPSQKIVTTGSFARLVTDPVQRMLKNGLGRHGRHHHHDPASNNSTTNSTTDDFMIDDAFEAWQCCASIHDIYTTNCREPKLASLKLLGIVSVLVLCGFVKSLNKYFQNDWIPDAAACIMVGATVGGILRLVNPSAMQDYLAFDNDLFLHILLPPIIFESALSIDKKAFRRDLFPIFSLAILGTVFSAVVVGFMTHFLSSLGSKSSTLPMVDSYMFGALISSIDPVATLGILSGVGISTTDTLYTMIFGEALLNDGVSIVLFDTLVEHVGQKDIIDKALVREICGDFLAVGFGSIGIGLACGILCTIYFWALRRRHSAVTETAIFFCFALIPFYISDGVHYSGIISIMTMGFFVSYFVMGKIESDDDQWMAFLDRHNRVHNATTRSWSPWEFLQLHKAFSGKGHLSSKSKQHVIFVAEVLTSIMETAIFAYLGLFLFNDEHFWDFRLNTVAILGCVVSRGLMVVILSAIINFFTWMDLETKILRCIGLDHSHETISLNDDAPRTSFLDWDTQKILFLAGVRGAVSFALVENVPIYDAVRKTGSRFKPELKGMTVSSILITVFLFGPITYFIVKREQTRNGPLARRLLNQQQQDSLSDDEEGPGQELVLEPSLHQEQHDDMNEQTYTPT